ncbi:MAG: hypothetical protein II839_11120 [Kiritimatiellae bacterium]|nr:hypothetical protein [Kiritimatiellia bacterium]
MNGMKGHPDTTPRVAARRRREGGFSLVEVALALMVAAGGMVAVFQLFPASMRQGVSSRTDMKGALFASTVLETIAGNVRQIDDIQVWNDPQKWWEIARTGLDVPSWNERYTAAQFRDAAKNSDTGLGEFSAATTDVAIRYPASVDAFYKDAVLYFGREEPEVDTSDPIPPQYLIRLETIRRNAYGVGGSARMPNRYLVTLVSSPKAQPQIFVHEQVYSQEYYFVHRP